MNWKIKAFFAGFVMVSTMTSAPAIVFAGGQSAAIFDTTSDDTGTDDETLSCISACASDFTDCMAEEQRDYQALTHFWNATAAANGGVVPFDNGTQSLDEITQTLTEQFGAGINACSVALSQCMATCSQE